MGNLVKDTLSAWLLIESLNPGKVQYSQRAILDSKYFKANNKQVKLRGFDTYYNIWDDYDFLISDEERKKGHLNFKFYRYCFRFNEINLKINDIFNHHSEIYNPSGVHCYSYTFDVDENGILDIDSLHVPLIMCALKELEKSKTANIKEKFKDSFEKFKQQIIEIVAETSINEDKLKQIDNAYKELFLVFPKKSDGLFSHYIAVDFIRKNQKSDLDFNSFFISDIELARNNPNDTLIDYIEGENDKNRIVVDENKEVIEDFLHPSNLPDGRWPSKSEFRLSLMQQLSVNQIVNNKGRISSVNGPPGTGKTTLLKDIFAHFVVERGKELAKLNSPKHAFERKKLHETDKYDSYLLKDEIAKFKMVVASSNNGAVENISKELPQLSQIVRNPSDSEFPKHEEGYVKLANELEDFSLIAKELINENAWGLFSGVFGKQQNINKVLDVLTKKDEENIGFIKLLQQKNTEMGYQKIMSEWKTQKELFNKELKKVEELKKESIKAYEIYKTHENSISKKLPLINKKDSLEIKIQSLDQQICEQNSLIESLDVQYYDYQEDLNHINDLIQIYKDRNIGFYNKLKNMLKVSEDSELQKLNDDKEHIILKLQNVKNRRSIYSDEIFKITDTKKSIEKDLRKIQEELQSIHYLELRFDKLCKESSIDFPSKDFWTEENYDKRQITNLWMSDDLQYHRAQLFLRSMILHRLLLITNNTSVYYAIEHFKQRRSQPPELVYNAWNVIHLIFPVVSTTLASFNTMYDAIPKDFIDYLFIDEAGQAVPQAAVGALYRSENVTAVGDPIQIEPVVTLESSLIDNVRKSYNVPARLISKDSSVQSVADYANRYGFWKKSIRNEEQPEWIGIPLWVHRRCLNPMFTIANQISYDNKMVLPKNQKEMSGKTGWYDVTGKASSRQYVPEHGYKVLELLVKDWIEAISNNETEPDVFVISPFTEVKNRVLSLVSKELPNMTNVEKKKINSWAKKSIGTVHTFQGKEAAKVYFVIGTDSAQDGAVNWSCEKPNLLNVAVTRAKKEFYVIGDLERIKSKPYYEIFYKEKNIIV